MAGPLTNFYRARFHPLHDADREAVPDDRQEGNPASDIAGGFDRWVNNASAGLQGGTREAPYWVPKTWRKFEKTRQASLSIFPVRWSQLHKAGVPAALDRAFHSVLRLVCFFATVPGHIFNALPTSLVLPNNFVVFSQVSVLLLLKSVLSAISPAICIFRFLKTTILGTYRQILLARAADKVFHSN
ncbi:hypothetical protein GP486_005606 [Trichoglossum hirsutum]|uniref:Uncharacterized protein n=1 Tax=Trichoglossum hirsutum TaxID=265104 RepID=A0A9P8L8W4_9PEZI|nr:hypothetical protein GP486_005606 [Trichoglossum hirsutum]